MRMRRVSSVPAAEDGAVHGEAPGVLGGLLDGGELARAQPDDAVLRRGGDDARHVLAVDVELDLALGGHAQDFDHAAHGQGRLAGLVHLHVGRERRAHRHVQIRRGEGQRAVLARLDEGVRDDLQRGPRGHHALHVREQLQKAAADDGELHGIS